MRGKPQAPFLTPLTPRKGVTHILWFEGCRALTIERQELCHFFPEARRTDQQNIILSEHPQPSLLQSPSRSLQGGWLPLALSSLPKVADIYLHYSIPSPIQPQSILGLGHPTPPNQETSGEEKKHYIHLADNDNN